VQVLQGPVDYAGTNDLTAGTSVVATVPAADLSGYQASVSIGTSTSSFVRTQVLDPNGAVIGISNPVWLLRELPPQGIPAPRATS